jgi:hypothetical protein
MKPIIILLCMLSGLSFAADAPPICPHNRFICLEHHMDDFYIADHDRFYRVYTQAFSRAMQCHNVKDVATYLSIYSWPHDSAEIDESIAQDTEALLLLKPKCFFAGGLRLNSEQRENLVGNFHLFSRPNHVMTLLHKYMQGGKYKRLAGMLYNAKLDAYQAYDKDEEDASMADLYAKYKH